MSLTKTLESLDDKLRIVTPQLIPWLEQHGDDPYPSWVAQLVKHQLETPKRVRSGSFSASGSGTCLRAQELAFLGLPATLERSVVPASMMAVYDNGSWGHLRWQARLLAGGIIDRIEVLETWPDMNAAGTADGAGITPSDHPNRKWRDEEFGLEVKTVSPYLYPRWVAAPKPQPKHLRQIHRYFLMTGWRLFSVIYENKGTNDWHEWVVRPDAYLLQESMAELKHLNEAVRKRKLHDMLPSCKLRMGPNWKECPFAGRGGTCERTKTWLKD